VTRYLRNECYISIGEPGEGNKNIKHEIVLTNDATKRTHLLRWVHFSSDQTIVFCRTQHEVESVAKFLQAEAQAVGYYHAGKSQAERESTIEKFKKSRPG